MQLIMGTSPYKYLLAGGTLLTTRLYRAQGHRLQIGYPEMHQLPWTTLYRRAQLHGKADAG